jgi:hypothetical protein
MNNFPWYVSSTGQGVAQRLISLVALILPILSAFGVTLAPADVNVWINSLCIVVFGVWHFAAWARAAYQQKYGLGRFAPPSVVPK